MTAAIHLVDGPPGTGKTTFLSRQAARAVEKHGAMSVAIASLTRTAAHEIATAAGRTTRELGQMIPEDHIGTLHAHAYRALDRPDLAETPEAVREWNEAQPGLALSIGGASRLEDTPIDTETGGRSLGDDLHSQVMNHRARLTPRTEWTDEQQDYAQRWDDFKAQTHRLDFTDLIDQAATELPSHPARPKVLLLDEAQDFSRAEMRLALRWAQGTDTTVIVGDTDQALYQWRGSDPDTLNRIEVAGRRGLEQSHRVPKAVHQLAVRWIRQIAGRRDVTYHPTAETGEARALPITLRYPEPLIDEIQADIDAGRTVMILTSCGYMLASVTGALRAAGLPFHNPHRPTQGAWNPMRASGRLLAFLRPDRAAWGEKARMWTWADLRYWTEPLKASGTLIRGAKKRIDEEVRIDAGLTARDDRRLTVAQLLELFPEQVLDRAFALDVDWWQSSLLASYAKSMAYPATVLRRRGAGALQAEPRITVGTVHSVKGAEASSVYLFPDLSRTGMWHGWDGDGRDQIIRMFYVGLTRARARVTVLAPSGAEHIPLDLLSPEQRTSAAPDDRWKQLEGRLAELGGKVAA